MDRQQQTEDLPGLYEELPIPPHTSKCGQQSGHCCEPPTADGDTDMAVSLPTPLYTTVNNHDMPTTAHTNVQEEPKSSAFWAQ